MQLHPEHMFPSSPGFADLFHDMWKEFMCLPGEAFMVERCEELTRNIRAFENAHRQQEIEATTTTATTGDERLPCFVDEAQVLLQSCEEQFLSATNPSIRRSCFYAVGKSLATVCKGPVMAGAGVPIAHAGRILLSDDADENAMQAVRTCHLEPAQCRQHIERYLTGIEQTDLARICNALQGRPRFAEQFVGQCIVQGNDKDVMTIFDEFLTFQTTEQPTRVPRGLDNASKLSAFHCIDSAVKETYGMSILVSDAGSRRTVGAWLLYLVQELKLLALRYALTGQLQLLFDNHRCEMLTHGLANVQQLEGRLSALIREPIVIRAACNYFGLARYLGSLLREFQDNAAVVRSELPTYVALALFDSGSQPFLLGVDAPINVNSDSIPPNFQGSWKLWLPRASKQTGVVATACNSNGDLQEFLGRDPRYAMVFPDKRVGPNVLLRVHDPADEGRRLMVAIHDRDCDDVKANRVDGKKARSRKGASQRRSDAGDQPSLPLLNIVVAFPATLGTKPVVQVESDQEMTLILDGRNFERAIRNDDGVCNVLKYVLRSNEKGKRRERPEESSDRSAARKSARK
jgi:hypothetical protein